MSGSADGLVVLAVDDEQPALDDLAFLLGADEHVDTVLTATDATEAMKILDRHGVDLAAPASAQEPQRVIDAVFIDIRMPGVDGLELARFCVGLPTRPSVVFVTAHEDRAVAAFDLGAADYLLKPLHSARLGTTLGRIAAARTAGEAAREVVPVELGGTTTLVPLGDVHYVEAQGDYVRLHTTTDSHLVRMPLGQLEERWRDSGFLRVHRSFLVGRSQITALRRTGPGYVVRVDLGERGEVELPVSRRHLAEMRAELRGDWTDIG